MSKLRVTPEQGENMLDEAGLTEKQVYISRTFCWHPLIAIFLFFYFL